MSKAAALPIVLQCQIFQHQLTARERSLDQQFQAVQVDRLGEKIVRAGVHGGHRALDGAVTGENDHRNGWVSGHDTAQQLLARQSRHAQVADHQVHRVPLQDAHRLAAGGGHAGTVPGQRQRLAQPFADVLLVVDDEDRHALTHTAAAS